MTTTCYRAGSEWDPAGQEGLAALVAEIEFTAAAGDAPRTRDDLPSQRPLGAGVKVTRHYAQLTEIASTAQFPGVLHQVAARIRGITPTDDVLTRARATVLRQLGDDYFNRLDRSLYFTVRALAAGANPTALERYGSGSGLEKLVAKDFQKLLADAYAPPNGVLCIAGNLAGVDVRRLLEHEFPTGETAPAPYTLPRTDARAGVGTVARAGLTAPRASSACSRRRSPTRPIPPSTPTRSSSPRCCRRAGIRRRRRSRRGSSTRLPTNRRWRATTPRSRRRIRRA